jgi:hypothetical protein
MSYEPDNSNWKKNRSTYDEIEPSDSKQVANQKNIDTVKWIHLGNLFITPAIIFALHFFEMFSDETTSVFISVWLISVFGLFLLIPVYQGFREKRISETTIDADTVANGLTISAAVIGAGVLFRVMYGCYQWLRDGYWEQLTLCKELDLFCSGGTEFVGFNKIITGIGSSDFTFVGIVLAILLGVFANAYKS